MLLFRSEEHVDRWAGARGIARGAVLTPAQVWGLGRAWYADRLDPTWRRRGVEEAETLFRSLGLTGPFWRLSG
jgi:hypothetical protein